jgi:hypothetical protein
MLGPLITIPMLLIGFAIIGVELGAKAFQHVRQKLAKERR